MAARAPRGILFDFYNTLGTGRDPDACIEAAVLAEFGIEADAAAVGAATAAVSARMNGAEPIDHRLHSASAEHYLEYLRELNAGWLREFGIDPYHPGLFERLCERKDHPSRFYLFEDTIPALERLRAAGLRIGLVSNWSWFLQEILDANALSPLLDCTIVSARAGYRKPHPAIYQLAIEALDLPAAAVVFVGDHPHADVHGPQAAGMTPVHIDRYGYYEPMPGVARITRLDELIDLLLPQSAPAQSPHIQ
jgi:putative hydrolase of the HAD superfamily